jgi:hypothetical protein
MTAVRKQANKPRVCEALAARQSQTFNPCTNGKGMNAAIINSVCQSRQVEPLNEVSVGKVRIRTREGSTDKAVLVPGSACWAVPEQINAVSCPCLGYAHAA